MKRPLASLLVVAMTAVVVWLAPSPAHAQDPYGQPGYGQPGGYDQPPPVQYGAQQPMDPSAMQYGYFGPHPEPYDQGQGICPIEGPHFHPYPPFDQYLFREANGYFYFIGDLGDFGYQGQMWGYQGNHPLPIAYGGGYCYIGWPHHHPFPPPVSMLFNMIGGYYAYAGPWAPSYYTYRAAWAGYFGGYYRNSYFGGRYWSVRPRAIYARSYGWGARGVYRPGTVVNAPGGMRVTVGRPTSSGGGYGRPGYYGGAHAAGTTGGYYPHAGGGTYASQSRGGNAVGHPAGNSYYAQPGRVEPARAESMRAEPMRAEPMRAEPMRAEPMRAEPMRAEPMRAAPMESRPIEMRSAPSRMSEPTRRR